MLLAALEVERLQATLISYNAAMSTCEKANAWKEAVTKRLTPDAFSVSAVVSGCAKAKAWIRALAVFSSFRRTPNAGSLVATTAAVAACAQSARWAHALQLLCDGSAGAVGGSLFKRTPQDFASGWRPRGAHGQALQRGAVRAARCGQRALRVPERDDDPRDNGWTGPGGPAHGGSSCGRGQGPVISATACSVADMVRARTGHLRAIAMQKFADFRRRSVENLGRHAIVRRPCPERLQQGTMALKL
ncbi:unnamed protein product [Symbiodinium microadriaticum]|nr:unnamed protein product [Symbiodinium microadriaticum]